MYILYGKKYMCLKSSTHRRAERIRRLNVGCEQQTGNPKTHTAKILLNVV